MFPGGSRRPSGHSQELCVGPGERSPVLSVLIGLRAITGPQGGFREDSREETLSWDLGLNRDLANEEERASQERGRPRQDQQMGSTRSRGQAGNWGGNVPFSELITLIISFVQVSVNTCPGRLQAPGKETVYILWFLRILVFSTMTGTQ